MGISLNKQKLMYKVLAPSILWTYDGSGHVYVSVAGVNTIIVFVGQILAKCIVTYQVVFNISLVYKKDANYKLHAIPC